MRPAKRQAAHDGGIMKVFDFHSRDGHAASLHDGGTMIFEKYKRPSKVFLTF